jgi:hypothetical protein
MVYTPRHVARPAASPSSTSGGSSIFSNIVIHKGVGQFLLVLYSGLQAGLLVLLVRTMGKPALTSCS